ncbi:MAG: hypothetical protein GY824_04000, partial [Delftia sp.]|nr:hypothetical protein [Delftia sp.]
MGVEPALAERSSKMLRVAAITSLVLAVLLAIVLALGSVRWLAWVEVGLVAVGLGLGLAAWMVHRGEDRFDARAA